MAAAGVSAGIYGLGGILPPQHTQAIMAGQVLPSSLLLSRARSRPIPASAASCPAGLCDHKRGPVGHISMARR